MKAADLTGEVFGRWTVLGPREIRRGIPIWWCKCSCGTEKWVVPQTLRNGGSRSCGCLAREQTAQRFLKNLAGKKFHRLMCWSAMARTHRVLPQSHWHLQKLTRFSAFLSASTKARASPAVASTGNYRRDVPDFLRSDTESCLLKKRGRSFPRNPTPLPKLFF